MKDYNAIIEEKEKEIERLTGLVSVLECMEREQKYHMEASYNDNGEIVKDENGEIVYKEPEINHYEYKYYNAWSEAIKAVEKLIK